MRIETLASYQGGILRFNPIGSAFPWQLGHGNVALLHSRFYACPIMSVDRCLTLRLASSCGCFLRNLSSIYSVPLQVTPHCYLSHAPRGVYFTSIVFLPALPDSMTPVSPLLFCLTGQQTEIKTSVSDCPRAAMGLHASSIRLPRFPMVPPCVHCDCYGAKSNVSLLGTPALRFAPLALASRIGSPLGNMKELPVP